MPGETHCSPNTDVLRNQGSWDFILEKGSHRDRDLAEQGGVIMVKRKGSERASPGTVLGGGAGRHGWTSTVTRSEQSLEKGPGECKGLRR